MFLSQATMHMKSSINVFCHARRSYRVSRSLKIVVKVKVYLEPSQTYMTMQAIQHKNVLSCRHNNLRLVDVWKYF